MQKKPHLLEGSSVELLFQGDRNRGERLETYYDDPLDKGPCFLGVSLPDNQEQPYK